MAELIGLLVIIVGIPTAALLSYRRQRQRDKMLARAGGGGKAPCRWLRQWDQRYAKDWARRQWARRNELRLAAVSVTGPEDADEVIELCITDGNGTVMFDSLLRPHAASVAPSGQRMHGISDADLETAPTLESQLPRIRSVIGDAELLFHNRKWGYEKLRSTCLKHGVDCPPATEDDLLLIHALHDAEWSAYDGHYELKQLPGTTPWRARDACRAMQQLLKRLAAD